MRQADACAGRGKLSHVCMHLYCAEAIGVGLLMHFLARHTAVLALPSVPCIAYDFSHCLSVPIESVTWVKDTVKLACSLR